MMATCPVTLDELVKKVDLSKASLRKRCTDDHLSDIALFLDWRIIVPQLGLKEADKQVIEQEVTEDEKRLKTLQKWAAKCGYKATYRRLTKALLKVGRADHAEKVCRMLKGQEDADETSSSSEILGSGDEESSSVNELSPPSATQTPDLPGSKPTLPRKRKLEDAMTQHPIPKRRKELEEEIHELDEQFSDLVYKTACNLKDVDLLELKLYITRLPHLKALTENLSDIDKADSVFIIFSILNVGQHWSFLNCGPLEEIIEKFGDPKIKGHMKEYLQSLQQFRCQTTIKDFIESWIGKRSSCYSQLLTKMENWENSSLEELEQFRKKLSRELCFDSYLPLQGGQRGCLALSWGLHCSFPVEELALSCQNKTTRHFLKQHGVLRIEFKGTCIFDLDSPQNEVNVRSSKELQQQVEESHQTQQEAFHAALKEKEDEMGKLKMQAKQAEQKLVKEKEELQAILELRENQLEWERRDKVTMQERYKKHHQQRVRELEEQLRVVTKEKEENQKELTQMKATETKSDFARLKKELAEESYRADREMQRANQEAERAEMEARKSEVLEEQLEKNSHKKKQVEQCLHDEQKELKEVTRTKDAEICRLSSTLVDEAVKAKTKIADLEKRLAQETQRANQESRRAEKESQNSASLHRQLQKEKKDVKQKLQEKDREIEDLKRTKEAETSRLNSEIDRLKSELAKKQRENHNMKETYESEIQKLQKQLKETESNYKDEILKLKKEKHTLELTVVGMEKAEEKLKRQIAEEREQQAFLKVELERKDREKAEHKRKDAEKRCEDAEKRVKEEQTQRENERRESQLEVEELKKVIRQLSLNELAEHPELPDDLPQSPDTVK